MKVDDRLHTHRKTRSVTRSHDGKRRDVAPMGLWVVAGSWCGQNGTSGWVPEDELDRWDDDWDGLVARLVKAGYWWPEERDGEPGYGFVDWEDYNPSHGAAESGTFGNHIRWHVNRKVVEPECEHCPSDPDGGDSPPDYRGDSGGDIGGRSVPESPPESRNVANPDPTRPEPEPDPQTCASAGAEREFEDWWKHYPRKRGKGQAARAYRAARKKADAATLVTALDQQADTLLAKGPEFCPYPATWLNGERWEDVPDQATTPPRSRLPHASELELPPDGLSPAEYAEWDRQQRERRRA